MITFISMDSPMLANESEVSYRPMDSSSMIQVKSSVISPDENAHASSLHSSRRIVWLGHIFLKNEVFWMKFEYRNESYTVRTMNEERKIEFKRRVFQKYRISSYSMSLPIISMLTPENLSREQYGNIPDQFFSSLMTGTS